MIADNVYKA